MAALVCEICGGKLTGKAGGIFVCESCGMEYDKSWAQEKIQEIKGTVKIEGAVDVSGSTVIIDNTEDLKKLYNGARIALNSSNFVSANDLYRQILAKDPTSWEANFYTLYCQSMLCKISDIDISETSIQNALPLIVSLIKKSEKNGNFQNVLNEICEKLIILADTYIDNARKYFHSINVSLQADNEDKYHNRVEGAISILLAFENIIVKSFQVDECYDAALNACNEGSRLAFDMTHEKLFGNKKWKQIMVACGNEKDKLIEKKKQQEKEEQIRKSLQIEENEDSFDSTSESDNNMDVSATNNPEDFVILDGVLKEYKGNDTSIIIPQSVTEIESFVFKDCEDLHNVTIPNSVVQIGESAFANCKNLTSVVWSNKTRKIEFRTFCDCENLRKVTIPEGVEVISVFAFRGCKRLKSLDLPDSLYMICDGAFKDCVSIESVSVPRTVYNVENIASKFSNITKINIRE